MLFDEELFECEEEALEAFRSNMMTDKEDILNRVYWEIHDWKREAENDPKHTLGFYKTLQGLLKRFESKIEKSEVFDAPEGWWAYSFEITSSSITLMLEHYSSVDFDRAQGFVTGSVIDQTYDLISVASRLLTVDEYARLYDVEQGTVRQWIRRGKIRTARKYGKEWRIPELTELPGRGYRMGQFQWEDNLPDLPEEYAFLNEYTMVTLSQDDVVKTLYRAYFNGKGNSKSVVYTAQEREKLELLLISHPLIRYSSDSYGSYI